MLYGRHGSIELADQASYFRPEEGIEVCMMLKTAVLMAILTALFGFIGLTLGGFEGLIVALLFAVGINVFAWYNSDQMVLKMYRA